MISKNDMNFSSLGVLTSDDIEVKISFVIEYLYFKKIILTAMPPAI